MMGVDVCDGSWVCVMGVWYDGIVAVLGVVVQRVVGRAPATRPPAPARRLCNLDTCPPSSFPPSPFSPPPFNKADAIKAAKLRLFVRRGGPNYQAGLAAMRAVGDELGIPVEVHGPEASMTGICARAIEYVTAAA